MAIETTRFDASEYLTTPEHVAAYLEAVLEEGDANELPSALGTVAKAAGMSMIASEAGITRPALYKALSDTGDPKLSTIAGVLRALGLRIAIVPAEASGD